MSPSPDQTVFIHGTACVDQPCRVGRGTKVWHFCHVMAGAEIGESCVLGQNVYVAATARIGNNVKIQNNVSVYDGCLLEDDVFCGPSVVFTNVKTPRSAICRKGEYALTRVERGATLGANATVVCGNRVGRHAFVAAGAVVTADVPAYALVAGVPARRVGWVGRAGIRLRPDGADLWVCPETGERYRQVGPSSLEPVAGPAEGAGRPLATAEAAPVPMVDLRAQFRGIEGDVRAALERVLTSQRFILGQEVSAFECEMEAYTGSRHAVACASGSDALLLALLALELEPGDEVLTTPYTFFATAGAAWRLGLRVVFCDIDPSTFNLDVAGLEAALTPRTRAVIPVHLFGQSCEMAPLLGFARRHRLHVVEDAAQALGARDGGVMVGTAGTLGCYSFFPSKNLGCYGDGGMVVTDDEQLAGRLRSLRTHGAAKKYFHELVGLNSRLDEIQAAVLRAKLPSLDAWCDARRERAATYRRLLRDALPPSRVADSLAAGSEDVPPGVVVVPQERPGAGHVYNQFVVRVAAADRDGARAALKACGVATEVYYPLALHLQECVPGRPYREGDFPRAERASRESLALPMFPELQEAQQRRAVAALASYLLDRGPAETRPVAARGGTRT
jgi:dTDP-4-amino-4,6-dideoxygalactose transaminase/acetyltransferase-like isoleucine patch superfamily enzyme